MTQPGGAHLDGLRAACEHYAAAAERFWQQHQAQADAAYTQARERAEKISAAAQRPAGR